MRFRVTEGFDGGWILLDGDDDKVHHVGHAYEPGAAAARAALPRVVAELEVIGITRWCEAYSVDRSAFASNRSQRPPDRDL